MPPKHTVPLPGWAYSAGGDGHIYAATGRRMAEHAHSDGYLCVRLVIAGRRRRIKVHRAVAFGFHGPPPSAAHQVRHLDGNPINNAPGNLAWGTAAENAADRVAHGRTYRPDWADPAKRERWIESMRNGKPRGTSARAAIAKATGGES